MTFPTLFTSDLNIRWTLTPLIVKKKLKETDFYNLYNHSGKFVSLENEIDNMMVQARMSKIEEEF
jgi:hypothetical protein